MSVPSGVIEGLGTKIVLATEGPSITGQAATPSKNFLPSMRLGNINKFENQDFSFKILLANSKPITDLFFPEFQLAKGGAIYGKLNTAKDLLKINIGLDFLKYKSFKFDF